MKAVGDAADGVIVRDGAEGARHHAECRRDPLSGRGDMVESAGRARPSGYGANWKPWMRRCREGWRAHHRENTKRVQTPPQADLPHPSVVESTRASSGRFRSQAWRRGCPAMGRAQGQRAGANLRSFSFELAAMLSEDDGATPTISQNRALVFLSNRHEAVHEVPSPFDRQKRAGIDWRSLVRWWRAPLWLLALATGAKSFADNPILGSQRLNRRGLHVARLGLAHQIAWARRRRLAAAVRDQRREHLDRAALVEERRS